MQLLVRYVKGLGVWLAHNRVVPCVVSAAPVGTKGIRRVRVRVLGSVGLSQRVAFLLVDWSIGRVGPGSVTIRLLLVVLVGKTFDKGMGDVEDI